MSQGTHSVCASNLLAVPIGQTTHCPLRSYVPSKQATHLSVAKKIGKTGNAKSLLTSNAVYPGLHLLQNKAPVVFEY
jgi:hypothetical protein